jgi:hypothetical protein
MAGLRLFENRGEVIRDVVAGVQEVRNRNNLLGTLSDARIDSGRDVRFIALHESDLDYWVGASTSHGLDYREHGLIRDGARAAVHENKERSIRSGGIHTAALADSAGSGKDGTRLQRGDPWRGHRGSASQ